VTDPHARMVAKGSEGKVPQSAVEFETCFHNSGDWALNLSEIATFEEEIRNRQASSNTIHRSVYVLPFYKQVGICTSRQFQVLWGDKLTFLAKFGLAIFQSLIVGSLFYNQPATSSGVFTRGGVILYIISQRS